MRNQPPAFTPDSVRKYDLKGNRPLIAKQGIARIHCYPAVATFRINEGVTFPLVGDLVNVSKANHWFPSTRPERPRMSEKYTKYQQNIIRNFYENRDQIAVQKLQELVTELYLAEGKKRQKLWEQAEKHLGKIGLPKSQIDHLLENDDPSLLAKCIDKKF